MLIGGVVDVSDHLPIFCIHKYSKPVIYKHVRTKQKVIYFTITKLNESFNVTDWGGNININDINVAYGFR